MTASDRITPAPIAVPEAVLDDLRDRLARTRWPEPMPGTGWNAGADVGYVRELCEYWRDGYDWRAHEAALNRFPLFSCPVDGVDLQFWWVRGKGPAPVPLLLVHGWPGSIVEFHALIEPLTDPAASGGDPADAFDVVIPSLPGYGFGGRPREPGWGPTRVAEAFHTLMRAELGYERFGMQGGDWGAIVTSKLASLHPASIVGLHLNMAISTAHLDLDDAARSPRPDVQRAVAARRLFAVEERGYSMVQQTTPMSLAIAQTDSPAGLAAWIVEKFRRWSGWEDDHEDFEALFGRDTLLTNLMFYWAPSSIASSARLYYERRLDQEAMGYPRVEVPTAYAAFPRETIPAARPWVEAQYDLRRWTEMARGGHFAALEQPQLMLEDVRAFFRDLR